MHQNTETITIEQFHKKFVDQVVEIENSSFKSPWPIQIFLEEIKRQKSFCRVAVNNESISGYCISTLIYDELHILKIAVHQSCRRKGIGKYLLVDAFDFYKEKGAKNAFLEVRVSNKSAICLYDKIGFKPLSIRKNYYQSTKEDALVMKMDMEEYYQKLLSTT